MRCVFDVDNGAMIMNSTPDGAGARASWFVGTACGGIDDLIPRFLKEGIWEDGLGRMADVGEKGADST